MSIIQTCTNELRSTSERTGPAELSWFAIQTRPRYEKKVAFKLQENGIRIFLPLRSAKHQWTDRQQLLHSPLFPGYLFAQVASGANARASVLRTNGVSGFVGVRGIGIPILDDEIEALQALVEHRVPFEPHPYLKIGQRVRIRGGCLDGIKGVLVVANSDQSLVVSVDLIQRSVAIRISGYNIEAI